MKKKKGSNPQPHISLSPSNSSPLPIALKALLIVSISLHLPCEVKYHHLLACYDGLLPDSAYIMTPSKLTVTQWSLQYKTEHHSSFFKFFIALRIQAKLIKQKLWGPTCSLLILKALLDASLDSILPTAARIYLSSGIFVCSSHRAYACSSFFSDYNDSSLFPFSYYFSLQCKQSTGETLSEF